MPEVVPGVAGRVLDGAHEQYGEPAELDVGADSVLAAVQDRPQPQRGFMSRQLASTAVSCWWASARSSGVRVWSGVRIRHVPSGWASCWTAAWSMRTSALLVRRRLWRSRGLSVRKLGASISVMAGGGCPGGPGHCGACRCSWLTVAARRAQPSGG
jgi:hypothetical protein